MGIGTDAKNGFKHWRQMSGFDRAMLFIAVLGKTFLILQIIKIFLNNASTDVSFLAYVVYTLTSLAWLIFGLIYRDTVVVVSSFIGIVGGLFAMDTIVIFKEDKGNIL